MLMCDKTVTLVRHIKETKGDHYECTVIVGASWFSKTAVALENGGVKAANVVKVRIPAENMPEGIEPQTGDYFVLGVATDVKSASDLKGQYMKAQAVGDNRRGRLSHWAVTGS